MRILGRKPPVGEAWETSLAPGPTYNGTPIFLVRLASSGTAGMATLTPEDPLSKPITVEWAWGKHGDLLTTDHVPDWLDGLINGWCGHP